MSSLWISGSKAGTSAAMTSSEEVSPWLSPMANMGSSMLWSCSLILIPRAWVSRLMQGNMVVSACGVRLGRLQETTG